MNTITVDYIPDLFPQKEKGFFKYYWLKICPNNFSAIY
jgi:hypothetical protein